MTEVILAKILERKSVFGLISKRGLFQNKRNISWKERVERWKNTGFYVIPNKTQYEIGERVYLEIRKTESRQANHVKVSLFTYQEKI